MAQTMMTAWLFVACGISALAVLGYLVARNRSRQTGVDGAIGMIRSIDMEAFRMLIDPNEEAFLRSSLPPRKFRQIKRERARVGLSYLRLAGKAAVAIARAGQSAQQSSDPEVAASGARIAASALRLRLYTVQAGARLLTGIVLPGATTLSHPSLLDQYERTTETLLRLGRLQWQPNR